MVQLCEVGGHRGFHQCALRRQLAGIFCGQPTTDATTEKEPMAEHADPGVMEDNTELPTSPVEQAAEPKPPVQQQSVVENECDSVKKGEGKCDSEQSEELAKEKEETVADAEAQLVEEDSAEPAKVCDSEQLEEERQKVIALLADMHSVGLPAEAMFAAQDRLDALDVACAKEKEPAKVKTKNRKIGKGHGNG